MKRKPRKPDYRTVRNAHNAYRAARRALGQLLCAKYQTADGHPFELGLHEYWAVVNDFDSPPLLVRVDFWGDNWRWQDLPDEKAVLVLRADDYPGKPFPINDLYWDRAAAEQELRERQMSWFKAGLRMLEGGGMML